MFRESLISTTSSMIVSDDQVTTTDVFSSRESVCFRERDGNWKRLTILHKE